MNFKIRGLEKLDKLNLKLAKESFIKDMKQVSEYEEYITNQEVDLTLMLKAYKLELGRAC